MPAQGSLHKAIVYVFCFNCNGRGRTRELTGLILIKEARKGFSLLYCL